MASAPPWGFDLSPAARAVLRTGLTPSAPPSPPPTGPGWDELVTASRHHRLGGLLVTAVASSPSADAEQRRAAAEIEVELTRARMWHEQRTAEVVELLHGAGVDVRVLKGPALGALDYPDAQWRPTQDLDLLVRPEQIDQASDVLVAAGGRRLDPDPVDRFAATVGKGATIALPDGLEVDLHRLLVWGPLGVRTPTEELWRRSRPFTYGGSSYETLGTEETLLHACAHMLVLGWRRALTARDVAQVLLNTSLDPDRAIVTARRWDAEALLATGVLLARRELGLTDADLGDAALVAGWARGHPLRLRDRLWLRVERPDDPLGAMETAATYVELRSPDERRVLREATFRPRPGTYEPVTARARRVLRRNIPALWNSHSDPS